VGVHSVAKVPIEGIQISLVLTEKGQITRADIRNRFLSGGLAALQPVPEDPTLLLVHLRAGKTFATRSQPDLSEEDVKELSSLIREEL